MVPPANVCWGRIPKPLRSPPAVTAVRSANAEKQMKRAYDYRDFCMSGCVSRPAGISRR